MYPGILRPPPEQSLMTFIYMIMLDLLLLAAGNGKSKRSPVQETACHFRVLNSRLPCLPA